MKLINQIFKFANRFAYRFACTAIFILVGIFVNYFSNPNQIFAQELHNDYQGTHQGVVRAILAEEEYEIESTDLVSIIKTVEVEILEGPEKGKLVQIETDLPKISRGTRVYINHIRDVSGIDYYFITNINRTRQIYFLFALFCVVIIAFGGLQGLRSLIALFGSFMAILFLLLPAILRGGDPLFYSVIISSAILFLAIFFTHGFNRESLIAYVGTMIAVFFTSMLALYAVNLVGLSGFSEDVSVTLNFKTGGTLNFTGLLLGAIIIGVLGMLDDIAITQAAVVSELYDSNKKISRKEVYKRAMRVGKEHVGSLVNTLVLAYTGTALPILLLISNTELGFNSIINTEMFATEIVRTIVGSIGLVLTVPIVTILASIYLRNPKHRKHHLDLMK